MKSLLKQAYEFQKDSNHEQAIDLFLEIRKNKQYYEIATLEIAKCYKMSNKPMKAIDYFIDVLKYNENNKEAIKELSQTVYLSKNYDKAENLLKELFFKTKDNIFAIELVKIYFYKNNTSQIKKLIKENNLDENGIHTLLSDLQKNKKIEKKINKDINYYNTQIELDKNNYILYLERAKLKRDEKDYNGSMKDFDKASSINNIDPYIYIERGKLNRELKKLNDALKDFEIAIKLNNKIYWFFLELARLQEELGNTEQYFLNLNKALKLLDIELVSNNDNLQLYLDKLFLQRYLGCSKNIDSTLLKIKDLTNDTKVKKCIDNIQSVEKTRRVIAPYRCVFTWEMLHKCNYSCIYCEGHLNKKNIKNDEVYKNVEEVIDAWKNIYDKYGSSRIRLSGGEPSIYPNFFEIVKELSKFHRLQLGTNFSFDVNKFCDYTDPETIRIDASLHCEYTSLEDFIKKLEILKQKNYKLSVSYVAYPDFIKNISLAKKIIENMNIPFFVHPYSGYYNNKIYPLSYTDEEKQQLFELDLKCNFEFEDRKYRNNLEQKYFDNSNKNIIDKLNEMKEKLYLKNKKNNIYKKCRMGQMYAIIHPDGNTYRCCYNTMNLGNLFDKSVKLLEQTEKCYDIDNCRCWRCMVPGEEARWLHTWLDEWEI